MPAPYLVDVDRSSACESLVPRPFFFATLSPATAVTIASSSNTVTIATTTPLTPAAGLDTPPPSSPTSPPDEIVLVLAPVPAQTRVLFF